MYADFPNQLNARFNAIAGTSRSEAPPATVIGQSREGRAVEAWRLGSGSLRVSLIGGCHADEPVGPRLLRHLVAWLGGLPDDAEALAAVEWWIVPHANPDGEAVNRAWYGEDDAAYDPARYARHVVREPPGDDVEFCFPRDADDPARPETRAITDWWRTAGGGFDLHATLHGMALGAGPWFLIDRAWQQRCERLKQRCRDATHALGHVLHDMERLGEKGFHRFERGFCSRPDSQAMVRHFTELGDTATAALFRPNSMETVRAISAAYGLDTLTLVSEMPLFITPGSGETLGPPDPVAAEWKALADDARAAAGAGDLQQAGALLQQMRDKGLRPMPVTDQMQLQWRLVTAGIEQVLLDRGA